MRRISFGILFLLVAACGGSDSESSAGGDGGVSSSSGGSSSGNTTPAVIAPIGKKAGGFPLEGKDRDGALEVLAGTHEIAIYRTPPDKTAWLGPATLTLTRSGTELSAKLVAADGSTVQAVTNDMDHPRNYGQATVSPIIGMVLIDERGAMPYERIQFSALEDGHLEGVAGGLGQVAFRNDILAYGPGIPAQLSALDGTWKGEHMAALCRAPVEATFAAGKVTTKGKPQPGCGAEETSETAWDGNDDYVITNAAGNPQIFIDTANGGGSNASGGARIDLNPDGTIAELRVFYQGFQGGLPKGDVASINLKKQ